MGYHLYLIDPETNEEVSVVEHGFHWKETLQPTSYFGVHPDERVYAHLQGTSNYYELFKKVDCNPIEIAKKEMTGLQSIPILAQAIKELVKMMDDNYEQTGIFGTEFDGDHKTPVPSNALEVLETMLNWASHNPNAIWKAGSH